MFTREMSFQSLSAVILLRTGLMLGCQESLCSQDQKSLIRAAISIVR